MSDYFDESSNRISSNTLAKSSHLNSLRDELGVSFDEIVTDFSGKADTDGETYTGDHDFSGANSVSVPTPTENAHPATKQYADTLAFQAGDFPDQTDNSGKFITTDGSDPSWADAVTPDGVETLTNKTLTGYTETVYAITGTTPALDPDNGTVQTWTLTDNSTPTDSLSSGQSLTLEITAGAYSITWPTMEWLKPGGGGAEPTLYSSGVTIVELFKVGTNLYGTYPGDA